MSSHQRPAQDSTRRMIARSLLLFFLLIAALPAPTLAESAVPPTPHVPADAMGRDGMDGRTPRVSARLLVVSHPSIEDRMRVAVLFDLDPGWHLYWKNPGDTGLPTKLSWTIDGATAGPIVWPAPHVFDEADGLFTTYGYEGRVVLQNDVELDPSFHGERIAHVDADLLVCRRECIPAEFSLERKLDDALVNSPDEALSRRILDAAREGAPITAAQAGVVIEALYSQTGVRPGDSVEMGLAVHNCTEPDAACEPWLPDAKHFFFPGPDLGIELEPIDVVARNENSFVAGFRVAADQVLEESQPSRLSGVIALRRDDGSTAHVVVDLPIPWQKTGTVVTTLGAHWRKGPHPLDGAPGETAPSLIEPPLANATAMDQRAGLGGLFQAIALAFLGGLILNLMPCVLPVLAIKVFSVAELAERNRREVIAHGVAYTVGILASMAALAGAVLALRSAGASVGWGFQFQSPLFVAGVSMILIAFALNLFGTYEIQLGVGRVSQIGQSSTGTRRSFFEGLLAVVLSTPCSAPFLGTAVGFAFAGSAITIVAIFLSIGLGLAAPFLLVTIIPSASRLIPRSGTWMLQLRAGLGFALMATVVWLLWVVGNSAGVDGMITLLVLLLMLAFGLWIFGHIQRSGHGRLTMIGAASVLFVALAGLNTVGAQLSEEAAESSAAKPIDEAWRPFDQMEINRIVASGRPVLVAFSADWCITCKVNESVVLEQAEIQDEIARLGFELFKADWTRRDEKIRAELARHGRAGVPMYLVYDPKEPDSPRILSEILSVDTVLEALRTAAAASPEGAST